MNMILQEMKAVEHSPKSCRGTGVFICFCLVLQVLIIEEINLNMILQRPKVEFTRANCFVDGIFNCFFLASKSVSKPGVVISADFYLKTLGDRILKYEARNNV